VPGKPNIPVAQHLWGILASLLLTPGAPVSLDTLIDHLWGVRPPERARTTIRTYVCRINHALRATGGDEIEHSPGGYVLNIDPYAVDLHRFRSLRSQAEALAGSGDCEHACLLLRQADTLWRGEVLATLDGEWITAVRTTIEEERRAATLRRTGIELTMGRHTELLGELAQLCDTFPLDEVLAQHRMIALFRAGRQADALQVFRDMRLRLVDNGIQPGADLDQLHQLILRHDRRLAVTPAHQRAGQAVQPNTLPPAIHDFVGRASELRALTQPDQHSNKVRVCVIDGMGGVGKTALAVRAAHQLSARYPDAQLYLSFHADAVPSSELDPGSALSRLILMLDIPPERIPAPVQERARLWQSELRHRRIVIVLDDVSDPEQIRPLVPAAGDCLIIVCTRRRRADWPPAETLSLSPLTSDEALTLMIRIIGPEARHAPGQVAEAARLCGRLPLVIRVAAGMLRRRRPSDLSELVRELAELNSGRGDASETGRLIQSAFEFSYRQLTTIQQRFFRYLSISPCPDITIEIASAMTDIPAGEAESCLNALIEHHLVEQGPQGRIRFHDLVRAYAASRSAHDDPGSERRRALERLITHYLMTASYANQVLFEPPGPYQDNHHSDKNYSVDAAWIWLEEEWHNVLLITQYAGKYEWKRECADLAHAIGPFLKNDGYWNDALAVHHTALLACQELDDLPRMARAASNLSLMSFLTGHHEAAEQHAANAMAIYRSLDDRQGQASVFDHLGIIHRNSSQSRNALAHHQEAMAIYRAIGDTRGVAESLVHAGSAFGALGRFAEEIDCLHQALDICRKTGHKRAEAITLNNLGAVYDDQGRHREAMENYQQSLAIFKEIRGRQNIAVLEQNIGRVLQYKGDYEAAISIYRRVLRTYQAIGDLQQQAVVLDLIGSAFWLGESYSESLAHHQRAAALAADIGDLSLYAAALCGIADAHRGAGSYSAALEHYGKARKLATEIESPYLQAKALYGTAETLLKTRGQEAARIHWREAHDIYSSLGVPEAALVELRLDGISSSVG
jgi:DNA-binding SARP family transcriptional activator/tetratricopeptide (TPR) repeat protein